MQLIPLTYHTCSRYVDLPELHATNLHVKQEFLATEHHKGVKLREIISLLEHGDLPENDKQAHKLALQQSLFTLVNHVLYKVDSKKRSKQVVVPQQLCRDLTEEHH